ncbi:DUF2474 domain-containing protein [Microvirga arabica]|nr:DUF2474 domain-containing protein [Microvirga arabica]MBM1173879.1 DUF2474 domain-containing protein [Microvirga arabica]
MINELEQGSALSRWLWFVGLWAAGVGTTAAVGLVIRFWLA